MLAVLVLGSAACSPHRSLYPTVDRLARQGQYNEAARFLERNRETYGSRNEVLLNMDRGVLYHYAGLYDLSNRAFEAAERRIEELFTESVAEQAGAFLINDNTLPYQGEDFETVIINLYRALNYLHLGSVEAALVEARKVNLKLTAINQRYGEDQRNVYRDDAFVRFLMGIMYGLGDTASDRNDAFISYSRAAQTYGEEFLPAYGVGAPAMLGSRLLAGAEAMGKEEWEAARKRFPSAPPPPEPDALNRTGELIFLHFAGYVPAKVEKVGYGRLSNGSLVRIALPHYQPARYLVHGSTVMARGFPPTVLEVGEPVGAIARKNLEDHRGRIIVKTLARVALKAGLNQQLQRTLNSRRGSGANSLASIAGDLAMAITEQADLRTWHTLPDRILVGSLRLPAGEHMVTAQLTDQGGGVVGTRDLGTVALKAGQTRFLLFHTNY